MFSLFNYILIRKLLPLSVDFVSSAASVQFSWFCCLSASHILKSTADFLFEFESSDISNFFELFFMDIFKLFSPSAAESVSGCFSFYGSISVVALLFDTVPMYPVNVLTAGAGGWVQVLGGRAPLHEGWRVESSCAHVQNPWYVGGSIQGVCLIQPFCCLTELPKHQKWFINILGGHSFTHPVTH